MINRERLADLRERKANRKAITDLEFDDIFDTIESLLDEKEKMEAVIVCAELFRSESENPVPDLNLRAMHRRDLFAALAALRSPAETENSGNTKEKL